MALNLEKQLQFYGAYHHDPVNVGIHMVCIPLILLTSFLFGTNTPAIPTPTWLTIPGLELNLGTIAAIVYAAGYILMEPVAGSMLAPLLLGATAYSHHLTSEYGMKANKIAIGVHIVAWLAQFVGHGAFEGRAPALLDNLVQAIFLAPFFVWMELLFALGYRPELKSRLDKSIKVELSKLNAKKTAKAAGKSNGHAK